MTGLCNRYDMSWFCCLHLIECIEYDAQPDCGKPYQDDQLKTENQADGLLNKDENYAIENHK